MDQDQNQPQSSPSPEAIRATMAKLDGPHPPTICQTCKTELPFTGYGSKIGKNGLPAKWPTYEKCKNPDCTVGRKNLGLPKPVKEPTKLESKPLVEPATGPKYRLFQLTNRVNPPLIFDDLYDAVEGTGKARMDKTDMQNIYTACQGANSVIAEWQDDALVLTMGKKSVTIEPSSVKVTKGWGYFTVDLS